MISKNSSTYQTQMEGKYRFHNDKILTLVKNNMVNDPRKMKSNLGSINRSLSINNMINKMNSIPESNRDNQDRSTNVNNKNIGYNLKDTLLI